jgi:hypothetical protein
MFGRGKVRSKQGLGVTSIKDIILKRLTEVQKRRAREFMSMKVDRQEEQAGRDVSVA